MRNSIKGERSAKNGKLNKDPFKRGYIPLKVNLTEDHSVEPVKSREFSNSMNAR